MPEPEDVANRHIDPELAALNALPGEEWDPLAAEKKSAQEQVYRLRQSAGERALQRLAAKVKNKAGDASATDGSSAPKLDLMASLDKVDRRTAAASKALADEYGVVHSEVRPGDIPLEVNYTEGRYLREDDPDFLELPDHAKESIRACWQRDEEHLALQRRRSWSRLRKSAFEGLMLFAIAGLFLTPLIPSTYYIRIMAGLGIVAGVLWHVLDAGRFGHAMIALVAFLLATMPPVFSAPDPFAVLGMSFGGLGVAYLCAMRGQCLEFAKIDGSY